MYKIAHDDEYDTWFVDCDTWFEMDRSNPARATRLTQDRFKIGKKFPGLDIRKYLIVYLNSAVLLGKSVAIFKKQIGQLIT